MESKPVTARPRNDLDFLKEEGDTSHHNVIRVIAGVVCAVACGALIFFSLRPSQAADTKSSTAVPDGGPPRQQARATPRANLVAEPRFVAPVDRPPSFWLQQWDGTDLISNAGRNRSWVNQSPAARASAQIPGRTINNSLVKLDRVETSLIALPNGYKRVVAKADVVNGSQKNIVDFRCELIWGADEFSMIPLQGNSKKLRPVEQRALRPGKRISVQLVSQKIKSRPPGTPNSVRLTAWLDGEPGNTQDDYQLQFGH